ncbi:hypothetical protein [Candidatus Finniella inopinata]|uniref:Uncharacterized protein n=1 Tax=Candidatus Finniella inopinata TaxID=1696036 RepID=A0A4Q7DHE7_9PROT|nr:hypothetical protein [Candidatus Finniella inopinata]RZI45698.1 hypothetical protein EQU50_06240 [Candidatus Finniella inopinata]
MLTVKRSHRQKGRPRLVRVAIDSGTPEVQARRQIVINTLGLDGPVPLSHGHSAALDGCYLHQLFYKGAINQQQLDAGLWVRKLYHQCLRSQGIKNRLSCSSKRWDGLTGTNVDVFEKPLVEKQWYVLSSVIEGMQGDRAANSLILKVILNDSISMDVYGKLFADYNFLKSLQRSLDAFLVWFSTTAA